jgi:hypothetical protein
MKIFGKEQRCPTCQSPDWKVIRKKDCRDHWHYGVVVYLEPHSRKGQKMKNPEPCGCK